MSVSYPYFNIAKKFNIEYSKVLTFIDIAEASSLLVIITEGWQRHALDAWRNEKKRRKNSV